jgi:hypothetical protein
MTHMKMTNVYGRDVDIVVHDTTKEIRKYDNADKRGCREVVIAATNGVRRPALILDSYSRMSRQMVTAGWAVDDILVVEQNRDRAICQAQLGSRVLSGSVGEVLRLERLDWIGDLKLVWLDYCCTLFTDDLLGDLELLLRRASEHGNPEFVLVMTVCARACQKYNPTTLDATVPDVSKGAVIAQILRSTYGIVEYDSQVYGPTHMLMMTMRVRRYWPSEISGLELRRPLNWYHQRVQEARSW